MMRPCPSARRPVKEDMAQAMEKAGGREDDKATDLCLHGGRRFSYDQTATAVNCQKAVQLCPIRKTADVRTEGVGGRSGMSAPAVVCSITLLSPPRKYVKRIKQLSRQRPFLYRPRYSRRKASSASISSRVPMVIRR